MHPLAGILAIQIGSLVGNGHFAQDQETKFADCPAAVRKSLEAQAKGAKIEKVVKETGDDDQVVFWAEVKLNGRPYAVGVLEDGTLSELNLAVDNAEVPLEGCPAAVQVTLKNESFGEKIAHVGKDVKYGVTIYETTVAHKGKSYVVVVAEDGTLVEKVLVITDEEITLEKCPVAVRVALHDYAEGGTIGAITRSTGIEGQTFEAEVKLKDKIYLIDVAERGHLISKSLEAAEE
jgi:hypothetical protein